MACAIVWTQWGSRESQWPRYSRPFFCQANMNWVIQGPQKKYAPITANDYLQQRIAANFATMG